MQWKQKISSQSCTADMKAWEDLVKSLPLDCGCTASNLDGNKTVPFRTAQYAKMMYLDELRYFLPKSKWA